MNKDRENMTKSEMSLRKFLKNLGVTTHQIIDEKLKSGIENGEYDLDQEISINAEITIKELGLSHSLTANIITPESNE